jgi:hypothetical protein
VHPADLDGALQLGAVGSSKPTTNEVRLPFAIDSASLLSDLRAVWASHECSNQGSRVRLLDLKGESALTSIHGFKMRALAAREVSFGRRWHYELAWTQVPPPALPAAFHLELLVVGAASKRGLPAPTARTSAANNTSSDSHWLHCHHCELLLMLDGCVRNGCPISFSCPPQGPLQACQCPMPASLGRSSRSQG